MEVAVGGRGGAARGRPGRGRRKRAWHEWEKFYRRKMKITKDANKAFAVILAFPITVILNDTQSFVVLLL
ncbi:hypothetical protein L195_g004224 [Trifolium pratense]|uniref:Uncharacterized protein n=1 Tax=Trifolium pratense TaxID=57577 RepID=A0A2K3NXF3_TRIPR|nr:hypothetical protein L195_g002521 [Trifolium pratense]PNY06245.1 hypothetical protein L195_g002708 [Trifolium pratense]PNY07722.1 hypothetical protein L195_g004224 [Trifolium pratense]